MKAIWSAPLAALALASSLHAQTPPAPLAPVTFTTDQDHQNMMDQLHITTLRPGPSGNPNDPNHANSDPALANPYPDYPEILKLNDGRPVTTAAQWWTKRRPELVAALEHDMYGKVPANTPKVMWTAAAENHETIGATPVVVTPMTGHVDNSAYPLISVDMTLTLILPTAAKGPVPVLIMFVFPQFSPPPAADARVQALVADGWGVALLDPSTGQADNGAGLTRGIIGLMNKGQPRRPDDWGSLRAWAWGAGRVFDYLATRPEVDARRIGIEGVSRYGKAALVTMAFDPRFAVVLVGSSGEGGAKPSRRNFGEAVENLTGAGEYHWMAGNFLTFGGPKNAGDLSVDAPDLIALCAPRPTFISYGNPAAGDAAWLDQQGSFMATVDAGRVWTLLGAKALSGDTGAIATDYKTAVMPPIGTSLLGGQLAWRQHEGGHTDGPNVPYFIEWADAQMGRTSAHP